ncbi:YncE family protein [Streptomyces sp. NPDC058045]|uniref:YncE family protein n=1 Tax=Streptomyces sp. NPDC058045 TaxID=3346311 RepID=UPI0036E2FED2
MSPTPRRTRPVHPLRRLRRTAATAVALAAGSTVALTGTATAQPQQTGHRTPVVDSTPVAKGLYQSAYSERNHVLWATTAVGRPPVTESALLKLDPHTLAVRGSHTPPVTDQETGAMEAVYGVAVDDEHDTVWTTNTRDDSVAVYSQRTGRHLATLPNVPHARDVVVDERHNTAWASGFGDGSVIGFDTRTFKEKKRITVEGAGPTGLALNKRTGTVYAADLNGNRVIAVSPYANKPHFAPAGEGPISVALSRDGRTAYTTDQTAGTLSVVDLRRNAVIRTVPTGEGPLSAATDPRTGNVLVAHRADGNASIVDPRRGTVLHTLATGANPNHITVHGRTAYITTKSAAGPESQDELTRVHLTRR